MGKTREPGNHLTMTLGIVQITGKQWFFTLRNDGQQAGEATHCFVLQENIFGVLQHQVDEHPLQRC